MKRCLSWCWRNSHLGLCCLSLPELASVWDLNEMSCATSPIKCYVIIFSSTPHTMALKYTWQWCSRLKNYFRGLYISWSSTWLPDLNEFLFVLTLFLGCAIFLNKNLITAQWYSSFQIQKSWLYAYLVITIRRFPIEQWNCTILLILLGPFGTDRTAHRWDKNVSLFTTVTFAQARVNHKDVTALISVQVSRSEI